MREPSVPYKPDYIRWRLFLRAMAIELDGVLGAAERDVLLARVGVHMARGSALPPVADLDALEAEINAVLADLGWGHARFDLDETARLLRITHAHLPTLGSVGGPEGPWLSAVLEGLYTGWLAQQPDAVPGLAARRTVPDADGAVDLVYAKVQNEASPADRPGHAVPADGPTGERSPTR